jgi:hypothetical protein
LRFASFARQGDIIVKQRLPRSVGKQTTSAEKWRRAWLGGGERRDGMGGGRANAPRIKRIRRWISGALVAFPLAATKGANTACASSCASAQLPHPVAAYLRFPIGISQTRLRI